MWPEYGLGLHIYSSKYEKYTFIFEGLFILIWYQMFYMFHIAISYLPLTFSGSCSLGVPYVFIVVHAQLFPFSHHYFPPSHPHPLLLILPPFGFVHGSFIHVPHVLELSKVIFLFEFLSPLTYSV